MSNAKLGGWDIPWYMRILAIRADILAIHADTCNTCIQMQVHCLAKCNLPPWCLWRTSETSCEWMCKRATACSLVQPLPWCLFFQSWQSEQIQIMLVMLQYAFLEWDHLVTLVHGLTCCASTSMLRNTAARIQTRHRAISRALISNESFAAVIDLISGAHVDNWPKIWNRSNFNMYFKKLLHYA